MAKDRKLIAISTNGHRVALVKNVDEQEYNKLLNEQEKELACEHNNKVLDETRHSTSERRLQRLESKLLLLAKSIYDNFVDRGLLDNDNEFQKMWFDYFFNGCELDLDKAPQEYMTILEKVRE